jgi:hypothetical protein
MTPGLQPNLNIGASVPFGPTKEINIGFFTDLSSVSQADIDRLGLSRIHMFGSSLTVGLLGKQLPLEFALLTEAQYAFLAVSVPDGKIVIGVSDDGRAIVKSKEGTWNCHSSSKGWSCTSDKGKSMDVTEDIASEGASASNDEASEPSDSSSDAER